MFILLNRQAVTRFSTLFLSALAGALLSGVLAGSMAPQACAAERDIVYTAVPVVLSGRMELSTPKGPVEVPIFVSRDWSTIQPDVTRAVIIIHGWTRRDLSAGRRAAKKAGAAAETTILITPQFLTANDVRAHQLSKTTLKWRENAWKDGEASDDNAAISSFTVVDDIIRHLANRSIFPNLHVIILAGHSAGGQFVQRYAAVGRGDDQLGGAPIHIRYVVANPASYLYFTADRPSVGTNGFTQADFASCPRARRWPYSLYSRVPAYARPLPAIGDVEARYLHRDIVYLLGTDDNDPHADGIDLTCAGEAEGPTRLARGLAYYAYVHRLDPGTTQQLIEVPGVAHSSRRMFGSPCGLFVLFGSGSCASGDVKPNSNS